LNDAGARTALYVNIEQAKKNANMLGWALDKVWLIHLLNSHHSTIGWGQN
jgi:hypothetical protein